MRKKGFVARMLMETKLIASVYDIDDMPHSVEGTNWMKPTLFDIVLFGSKLLPPPLADHGLPLNFFSTFRPL
jgi:hypothetical protein